MLEFIRDLVQNEVFSGLVGSSFVVSVLYLFKGIPLAIWKAARWRWTTTLVIYNEDPAFDRVAEWLASLEYAKRARKLRLTTQERNDDSETYWSPGLGKHLIWYKGRPVVVERDTPKEGGLSHKRREDITMTTFGSTPHFMHQLIQEILEEESRSIRKKTEVYLYNGYWRLACRKLKRPLDTVVVPPAQSKRIVGYVEKFLARREWYLERGVPYRLGLLFQSPPGYGKTSMVMALAAYFSRPVYALNLGSLKGDNDLFEAISRVPEYAILLIEDIDAAKVAVPRKSSQKKGNKGDLNPKEEDTSELTLSGLLNALDGAFTKDGRILIMTTNHPENIDDALIRPGRADHTETFEAFDEEGVVVMCQRFLGHEAGLHFAKTIPGGTTPAELQSMLLSEAS